MRAFFVKIICLTLYFITSIQAFALGPVSSLTAEELEDIESGVNTAIAGFRQGCVGTAGQFSVMPEIATGQVSINSVTNSVSGVGFSDGNWTFNTGWLAFTHASATGVTVTMPNETDVVIGQAYVASIILRVATEGSTACPTSISTCNTALTAMNTAISGAWGSKLTVPAASATINCSPGNGGPPGLPSPTTTDYAPVPLPPTSVNNPGIRDLIYY